MYNKPHEIDDEHHEGQGEPNGHYNGRQSDSDKRMRGRVRIERRRNNAAGRRSDDESDHREKPHGRHLVKGMVMRRGPGVGRISIKQHASSKIEGGWARKDSECATIRRRIRNGSASRKLTLHGS